MKLSQILGTAALGAGLLYCGGKLKADQFVEERIPVTRTVVSAINPSSRPALDSALAHAPDTAAYGAIEGRLASLSPIMQMRAYTAITNIMSKNDSINLTPGTPEYIMVMNGFSTLYRSSADRLQRSVQPTNP